MRVKDVMTQHPVCCLASDSAQMVAKALRDEDVGSLPVVADGDSHRLVGIITDRDLCCTIVAQGLNPSTTSIEGFMKPDPVSCRAEQSLEAARSASESPAAIRRKFLSSSYRMLMPTKKDSPIVSGRSPRRSGMIHRRPTSKRSAKPPCRMKPSRGITHMA